MTEHPLPRYRSDRVLARRWLAQPNDIAKKDMPAFTLGGGWCITLADEFVNGRPQLPNEGTHIIAEFISEQVAKHIVALHNESAPDWSTTDETGEPIHLRTGRTATGEGPADPPDPAFDHWGCWCADPACPGPPQCTATSWPFTPNDSQCIKGDKHRDNTHRDTNGFEWGGDADSGLYPVHPSITCPRCNMTSYNPNDIREGYCGNCHDWTTTKPVAGGN